MQFAQDYLLHLFTYADGKLYWRNPKKGSRKKVGDFAGYIKHEKYKSTYSVEVDGRTQQAHRLIWIMHNGAIPQGYEIDHISHDRLDNTLSNLRCVTHAENLQNKSITTANKSGVPGVAFHKRDKKWQAYVTVKGERKYLGTYSTKKMATIVRLAALSLYRFHPNHCKQKAA